VAGAKAWKFVDGDTEARQPYLDPLVRIADLDTFIAVHKQRPAQVLGF
jgi:hypothetical protein